jgi:hypothetical protein
MKYFFSDKHVTSNKFWSMQQVQTKKFVTKFLLWRSPPNWKEAGFSQNCVYWRIYFPALNRSNWRIFSGGRGVVWKRRRRRRDCSHTVTEAVSSSPNRPTFNIFCALSKQREFRAVSLANALSYWCSVPWRAGEIPHHEIIFEGKRRNITLFQ